MSYYLPGTTIENSLVEPDISKTILNNIFATGGLSLSQVCNLTGLEPYIVQNWCKRAFLTRPVKKLYTKTQLCRIIIINALKDVLVIDKITKMLSFINGKLSDASDDLIDDFDLYNYFVNLIICTKHKIPDKTEYDSIINDIVKSYTEPISGAKKRLCLVLYVMLLGYSSSRLANLSDQLLNEMN